MDIAIVGMSCRFPGARNYTEYWDNLVKNINSISEIPSDRWNWRDYYGNPESEANKTNVKWGGFIQDIDKFDPLFFKISPTEANYIDPQHRIMLEAAWHAIEDAGYDPRSLAGRKIGVYVGVSKNDYAELMRENKESIISFVSTGTVHSITANRISYLLDFTGKSEVVDTACSSFMVALNNAIRDIQHGLCESAVVGGVNAILTPTMYISHGKSGMLSIDGACRSFDEKANGYVRGEGVGVVYLKPLDKAQQDGDDIWGVVKGIAVAHGGKSNFLTAPKASSQSAVIRDAIKNANVSPSSISYIEAHGTGTPLGDPIEIEALKEAYSEAGNKNTCAVSSVKTNIGHLESAAGVAGLIKILLAFKHKIIPGLLNFNKLNPYIELKDSPFYIADKNSMWLNSKKNESDLPLRAGLSSFGMGGVNAHAILESPPVDSINKKRERMEGYSFKKMRCWFPGVALENKVNINTNKSESVMSNGTFKINDYFIRDHIVKNENIVPGVKYLDLFLTEAENRTSSEVTEIHDVFWMRPIRVLDQVISKIECIEDKNKNIELSIKIDDETYCTGKIKVGKRQLNSKKIDFNKLKKRCIKEVSSASLYENFKKNGLNYGDSFRVIQRCQFNKNEIICELKRSTTVLVDKLIEPSMADGVFQTVAALYLLNDFNQEKQLLPFYLKCLKIYEAIPEKCLVYARRNISSGQENVESYDMYICRDSGEIIAEFSEFVKRIYEKNTMIKDIAVELLTYKPTWIKRELGMHGENLSSVLVFNNDKLFLDKIRGGLAAPLVIQVKIGKIFKKLESASYIINPNEIESYQDLWASLKADNIKIDGIVYGWNFFGKNSTNNVVNLGIQFIFTMIKSLILSKNSNKVRILYLHHNSLSVESSLHSMIGGLSRTLAYENPNIILESIGTDTTDKVILADITCQEISYYTNAPLHEIRYESSVRKARVVVPNIQDSSNGNILLKQNGSYLITGGCGGLGFIFAKYLAREYQANLVLVGRSKLNISHEKKLQELIALGGSAQYVEADIGENSSVEKISSTLKEKEIVLNGVIHCAGMIDDAFIIKKTIESFDSVISPKVKGTIYLDQLTMDEKLDFFMVFSSIAAIMPNQGQCDYAAANSFLDEFIHYRGALAKENKRFGRSISINWPLWKNGGIGVNKEEEAHLKDVFGMLPLENERGVEIFLNTLKKNDANLVDQVIAIEGDKNKIEKHLQVFFYSDNHDLTSIDGQLKDFICQILKHSRHIDSKESFYDVGLDSVGLVKLTEMINKSFGLELKPTVLFENSSITKLSNYLNKHYVNITQSQDQSVKQIKSNFTQERSLIDLERSHPKNLEFIKDFSQKEYFMRDHIVDGKFNVPGACYIEMAIECGEMISIGKKVYKLTNNYWAKQLSTTGDVIDAQLKFSDKKDFYEYEVSSLSDNVNTLHALGQLYIADEDQEMDLGYINLDSLRSKCHIKRESKEIYQFIHAEGLHVGHSFMPMLDIVLSEDEALSHLILPDFISNTSKDYIFHPSLLTGVLQTALLNNKPAGMDNTQFIPIAIDEIVFIHKIPDECYVYIQARKLAGSGNDIAKFDAKISDKTGKVIACIKGLTLRNLTSMKAGNSKVSSVDSSFKTSPSVAEHINIQVETLLKEILSESIGLPASEIESNVELENYGINSVMIVDLNRALSAIFGNLSKTLFFEYKNIKELAEFFIENHRSTLIKILSSDEKSEIEIAIKEDFTQGNQASDLQEIFVDDSQNKTDYFKDDDIAIIGVSGRYPQAENLLELWENLKQGKDSITEMPTWRFDYEKFYKETKDDSLLSARWGGFVDNIDKFDPQFFNISPKSADLMDPQERLFLEVAWETVESAGYSQASLSGRSIGVFVGALWQSYTALAIEETVKGNPQMPDGLLYNIPNRVSFFFDWCGPSLVIDTACSGSLSALHFACDSVRRGDCEAALVGGVNLSFSSDKYLWLSKNNFLSSDGKCKSFGSDGDGYVPGEGVGAVYIKKLSDAIKDNDNILGVIKATSVNHGGKTNGYTVPNPNKQAELIINSINKSGIPVNKFNYIEAHGTGTSLGDPIEIAGIAKAFSKYNDENNSCAIGSIKSNIGHLEAAAGIAGLTKILLQMKYKMLVPSLHSEVLNSNIDFDNSFLKVQKELSAWNRIGNDAKNPEPYRAMLSSFGAGGSNAHAIIEEYIPTYATSVSNSEEHAEFLILPISASDEEQLKIYINKILNFLDKYLSGEVSGNEYENDFAYLRDFSYTFQVARRQMNERLVIIAKDLGDLKEKLQRCLLPLDKKVDGVYAANTKNEFNAFKLLSSDARLNQMFDEWVINKDYPKIAGLWVSGIDINWNLLYSTKKVKRIDTVTYPFKKERYWIKQVLMSEEVRFSSDLEKLHPLLHKNTSDFFEQRYSSTFHAGDKFLIKSNDKEQYVLPSTSCIEIIQEAVFQATNNRESRWHIKDVCWKNPVIVSKTLELNTSLEVFEGDDENIGEIRFEQYSMEGSQTNDKLVYAYGSITLLENNNLENHVISQVQKEISQENNSKEVLTLGNEISQEILNKNTENKHLVNYDSLQVFLISELAFSLKASVTDIESDKPFVDMGLDSISAMEWIDAINEKYGCTINETRIYDYPNLEAFSRFVLTEINSKTV